MTQQSQPNLSNPVSSERFRQMNLVHCAVEVEAEVEEIFSAIRFHEESLIWACFEKGVMTESDIRNHPAPKDWTLEQCRTWYEPEMRESFVGSIETMELAVLQLHLADVIEFGLEDIPEDSLRSILLKLVQDQSGKGLAFWRRLVDAIKPELHEWWRVSTELADDLIEQKQAVLVNEFGCWWGYARDGENPIDVIKRIAQLRRARRENS